jgi:glutamate dehydrogenase/leucine dehydrogenase
MDMTGNHPGGDAGVQSVDALHRRFCDAGVRRACLVQRDGAYRLYVDHLEPGAPPLLPLLTPYLPAPDKWEHEAIFIGRPAPEHAEIDTLFFAFVHDTTRGLAQGGLRLRDYTNDGELRKLFEDGLRLAQGMTMKNSMARLWWGGGKGIIANNARLAPLLDRPKNGNGAAKADDYPAAREILFEEYGRFVSELGGVYYTAADMNTDGLDMQRVLRTTRFVTCLPEEVGGSADPSPVTARGVFRAIKTAWGLLAGTESLRDVRVAVQGIGKVGIPLVVDLLEDGAQVWVGDTLEGQEAAVERLRAAIQDACGEGRAIDPDRLHVVPPGSETGILGQEVDVISPCAKGQTINQEAIQHFASTVKLVCGAANNMLGDEEPDAERMHARGVCYVPDFVCNRMGIMNCADEWMGFLQADSDRELDRVEEDVREIVSRWKEEGAQTLAVAREMAVERLDVSHPLDRMVGRGNRLLERYLEKRRWVLSS